MTISIVGSGNVAFHLANALQKAGHQIVSVYSRNPSHARQLVRKVKARQVPKISETVKGVDCIILAVNDDAIERVAKKIPDTNCLVLHTSGTEPLSILRKKFRNCGVLYPVQTFSKNAPAPEKIPFCIEGSNAASLKKVKALANSISSSVQVMGSRDRKIVHLAAVMANNFSNHLFAQADLVLKKQNLDFKILLPLIEETVVKLHKQPPSKVQTGPAMRGDVKTMKEHLALIGKNKKLKKLYREISESIMNLK